MDGPHTDLLAQCSYSEKKQNSNVPGNFSTPQTSKDSFNSIY